jgi:hypothetical protein
MPARRAFVVATSALLASLVATAAVAPVHAATP